MLFTLLAVSFYVSAASAQKASDAAPTSIEWTVQIDPLTTALGIAHVLFEKRLTSRFAAYVGPSLRLYDSLLTNDDEEGYRAYGIEYGIRYFLQSTAPFGLWAGLRFVNARLSFENENRLGGYVSGLFGYAWHFSKFWLISGALGISYFDYSVGGVGVSGVLPAAHTGIGVVF